ncbi:hypothetical protein [Streptomyces litchfieldiae]|uniref:Uncharacterized protein n=1 Tax=Streptomyces litchfieldiae TaxID=3075543 RepID=A0ABU2MJE9_9ACTN|nr:hypothetical protein [Streptomyces sp. DSM 44938]MDT0341665.1 hypothetical protein [Streptomyces sp. DSM 44938]
MAEPLPAPDSAPHSRSPAPTCSAGTSAAATAAHSRPPSCPAKVTTAKWTRRDSSPPAKSTMP